MLFRWLSGRASRSSQTTANRTRKGGSKLSTSRPLVEELEPRLVPANHIFTVPGADQAQTQVTFNWTLREAAYNNELGVYVVQDDNGTVGGLQPGEAGYAQAALQNAQVLFRSGLGAGAQQQLNFVAG